MRTSTIIRGVAGSGCLLFLLFVAALLVLGAFCVNYDLHILTGHTVAWYWALLLDLVTGGMAFPVAVILKVLTLIGVLHG